MIRPMLIHHTDIQQFCEAVWPWLLEAEADYCVLVGLVQRMREKGYVAMSVDELPEPRLLTVQSGEQIELVAIQTLKTMMSVSRGSEPAVRCLAEDLAAHGWQGKDISGICPSVAQLAEHYERLSGRAKRMRVRMRNFQISSVTMPPAAPGTLHRATADDRVVLGRYLKEFDDWLRWPIEEHYQSRADRIIGEGRAYFWRDHEPVSMALWTGRTPRGVRITCVYTPPQFRCRGYASNLVAHLSQQLLAEGRSFCFLNADQSNPTSNSIYQKIGYTPTCDSEIWEFAL